MYIYAESELNFGFVNLKKKWQRIFIKKMDKLIP